MLNKEHSSYDPYQIFEVLHTPCLILTVTVIRGRNITMGFQDLYDTPDPFLKLVMKSSPEGKKWTTVKSDQTNPVWNETFTFYINFQQANILEVNLMEYNSYWFNQLVGTVYFDLVNINEIGVRQLETFVFNGISQVDIEFLLEFDRNPTLRYSLCLSDQEKEFIKQRRERILPAMNSFLGETDGPACVEEVPTIAVIGSGGGFRAMTAYSGVFKALVETGILDCSTYVCGLSGSSWFLSTLYSHPSWPDKLDMSEFLHEIQHKMDKKLTRFLNASTLYTFYKIMAEKRKERQPVSFTDIFGRMVGETLIPDRMDSTLTAQREKIKDGASPMPLYTCVHVKKDVPARSFQEWVEFSPYEIGMPKYGTFMDSALFGSKFFMGKLVKQYSEQPLHFLQGIWGSAFCILFKRLFEDNRRIDPAEMLREQLQEQLVEDGKNSSSDCSDDDDDNGDDDESGENWSSVDSDASSVSSGNGRNQGGQGEGTSEKSPNKGGENSAGEMKRVVRFAGGSQDLGSDDDNVDSGADKADVDSAYEGEEDGDEEEGEEKEDEEDDMDFEDMVKPGILKKVRQGSLEARLSKRQARTLHSSAAGTNGDGKHGPSSRLFSEADQSEGLKKSVNWGACPTRRGETSNVTEQRRQAYKRAGSSMRKSRSGSKSYWKSFIKGLVESNSWEILSTRQGRAAVIHNFMRGLNLQQTYPISPFTPIDQRVIEGDEFDGNFEMHSTSVKHIYMVDAGLTFNSPYPLVLRPQRQVDIILSFDFSARSSDGYQPFKELLLAEKWAKLNRLPFPPIDPTVFEREGMKELYIFRHPSDPHCPIVFHFVLINKTFRDFKAPGVPRQTQEECEFADFDIFDDPKAPYSTFNFTYTHQSFQRLSKLTEFNTLKHIEDIRQVMKEVVTKKRVGPPRVPIQSKDIKLLRMKSVQEMRKLRKFITRMESRSSISGPCRSASCRGSIPNSYFPNSPRTHSPALRSHTESSFSSSQESSVFSSSPRDKMAYFTSSSFSSSRDFSSDSLGASLPSHIMHRMRQQQQLQQPEYRHQHQQGRQRTPLSSSDSVYGTPPSDSVDGFQELRKRQEEEEEEQGSGSSPRPVLTTENSVYGTPPKDTAELLSFNRARRLSSINEASFESVHPDKLSQPKSQEVISSSRKKPRVIDCSGPPAVSLSQNSPAKTSPVPASSPKVTSDKSVRSRSPSPSPKLKIPTHFGFEDSEKPAVVTAGKLSGNRSSGSSGVWSMTSGSGSTTSGSGRFTPAAIDLMKKKKRKESPPNPFFKNAHFMRSTISSGSSSSSLGVLEDQPNKFERGKSYRLSPQPLTLESPLSFNSSGENLQPQRATFRPKSPLTHDSNTNQSVNPVVNQQQSQTSSQIYSENRSTNRLQSQASSNDDFHAAAAAFRADGTPVVDQKLAKMFYESAKDKRKLFRRQSTVSSMNSISLEDRSSQNESSQGHAGKSSQGHDGKWSQGHDGKSNQGHDGKWSPGHDGKSNQGHDGKSTPGHDGENIMESDKEPTGHFRELFLSLEQESSSSKVHSFSSSTGVHSLTDRYYSIASDQTDSSAFDPEVMDLSEFEGGDGVSDTKADVVDMQDIEINSVSSRTVSVGTSQALQTQVSVENSDLWFDAKPCLS